MIYNLLINMGELGEDIEQTESGTVGGRNPHLLRSRTLELYPFPTTSEIGASVIYPYQKGYNREQHLLLERVGGSILYKNYYKPFLVGKEIYL